jgi:hypothetical protein
MARWLVQYINTENGVDMALTEIWSVCTIGYPTRVAVTTACDDTSFRLVVI